MSFNVVIFYVCYNTHVHVNVHAYIVYVAIIEQNGDVMIVRVKYKIINS